MYVYTFLSVRRVKRDCNIHVFSCNALNFVFKNIKECERERERIYFTAPKVFNIAVVKYNAHCW